MNNGIWWLWCLGRLSSNQIVAGSNPTWYFYFFFTFFQTFRAYNSFLRIFASIQPFPLINQYHKATFKPGPINVLPCALFAIFVGKSTILGCKIANFCCLIALKTLATLWRLINIHITFCYGQNFQNFALNFWGGPAQCDSRRHASGMKMRYTSFSYLKHPSIKNIIFKILEVAATDSPAK